MTPEARQEKIDAINAKVRAMIRQRYSITDEIQLMRTAPSEEFDIYNDYVEACRDIGRNEKEFLNLIG
ncbi:MAG: hypothetical protein ACR2IJ_09150 [Fluviibacter sp.]